jgi:PAB1-binding protein PBP1
MNESEKLFDINKVFDEDYYSYMQKKHDPKEEADFIIKKLYLKKATKY